jgi:crotonobetainyl-CoA:carnitine CoA-transferase CaiB-like acyl-CoA transferase
MSEVALPGLRVVELASGVAGAYCTKLLADLGAEVLKVEGPQGAQLRHLGPFPGDAPHPDRGGLHIYLDAGKRSCVLDLDSDGAARELLRSLVARADVLVEDLDSGRRAAWGLDPQETLRLNGSLVHLSVTPFGLTGPLRDWLSDEIVDWALGGYMYFTGDPAREPLHIPGHQSAFHAGMHGAFAVLAGLWHARRTGEGQHIDLSHWEATLLAHAWLTVAWTHCGVVLRRRGTDFLRCRDGWVYIFRGMMYSPHLFILIGRPELAEDERWNTFQKWIDNGPALWSLVEEWTSQHSKHEVVARAQELRIAATPVNTVADLATSPQLQARGWFQEVEQPGLGRVRVPGAPYKLSETPARPQGPAPSLGQHTGQVTSGQVWPGESRYRPTAGVRGGSDGGGPLAGIKVVEMTANWAGPLTGRLLGDLGATVVKIEIASRPATRTLYHVGAEPGKYHYNRSGYFNKMNRNKFGISLDVSRPKGREVFLRLIRWADVFIENNSPRVVRNLNITYDVLKEVNPRLVMVSESGFGATGPEADYVAFGANIETSCGLASVIGYQPGDAYRTSSFYADPIAGAHGAVAVMAALHRREETGRGQYIDLALQEAAACFMGEFLMDYFLNGRVAQARGNRHPRYAPQGCYPCVGEDAWVVLCVRSDDEWRRLCAAVGHPEWAERPELATAEGRRQHHDEVDSLIRSWTEGMDHWEAARILQQAGVPAAPVLKNYEIVWNEHLHERGYLVPVRHPDAGVLPYPGFPWKFSRTPGSVRLPAPRFAEHNEYVLRELLGLTDADIRQLEEEGSVDPNPQQFVVKFL